MADAQFSKFLNQGTGLFNRTLGVLDSLGFMMNAVELQFLLGDGVRTRYPRLKIVQWSGTESVWCKEGDVYKAPWKQVSSSRGSGDDSPDPGNVTSQGGVIAFYDSPGVQSGKAAYQAYSMLYVVQNFTAWVDSDDGNGERIGELAAWHSVVSLINNQWRDRQATRGWRRYYGNHTGLGWEDTSKAPPEVT